MGAKSKKARPGTGGGEVAALSFEAALAELERIVEQLEAGQLPLEAALALFERGQALAARCGSLLDGAELKVQALVQRADGPALEPFEADEAQA
jgi:exodeoxyribonuclease VII small subunit